MEREAIMEFFIYAHLPEDMQAVAKPFCELAEQVHATIPSNSCRAMALRHLLQAKIAAVQALLSK